MIIVYTISRQISPPINKLTVMHYVGSGFRHHDDVYVDAMFLRVFILVFNHESYYGWSLNAYVYAWVFSHTTDVATNAVLITPRIFSGSHLLLVKHIIIKLIKLSRMFRGGTRVRTFFVVSISWMPQTVPSQ